MAVKRFCEECGQELLASTRHTAFHVGKLRVTARVVPHGNGEWTIADEMDVCTSCAMKAMAEASRPSK